MYNIELNNLYSNIFNIRGKCFEKSTILKYIFGRYFNNLNFDYIDSNTSGSFKFFFLY